MRCSSSFISRSRALAQARIVRHHEDFVEEPRDGRLEAGGFGIRLAEARARRDGLLDRRLAASDLVEQRALGRLPSGPSTQSPSLAADSAGESFAMLRTRLNAVASWRNCSESRELRQRPQVLVQVARRNRQADAGLARAPRGCCADPRRALRSTYCSRSQRNVARCVRALRELRRILLGVAGAASDRPARRATCARARR